MAARMMIVPEAVGAIVSIIGAVLVILWLAVVALELYALLDKDSPTPAGSADSDMYPGAPSSQSREPGVEPRRGEGKP
jgi:hypothetical protein